VEYLGTYTDEKGRKRRIGSISGGGRYDGLVQRILGIRVPATGASIGVDRLAEVLINQGLYPEHQGPVLIVVFDQNLMTEYQKIAQKLRSAGIDTEVYYGASRGLKKQLQYADKKNCPLAILLGEDEIANGVVTVRDLKLGREMADKIKDKQQWKQQVQTQVPMDQLVDYVSKKLQTS
jgi:histidyl-tRNA synthetase